MRKEFLPFAVPSIGDGEIDEVVASLRSGWLSTGPKVKEFETAVATYVGATSAVAVSSCTAGLHLSLKALGVGPGDEVIVPTMTFCSTANVVEHTGATPVLVDVGLDHNVHADAIEKAITSATKAIMPVHFAGQAVDLDALYQLAVHHDLAVVEDAAHAIGSGYRGFRVGSDDVAKNHPSLRRTTVFSFYATKNLTTGEGGMVTTADELLADDIRVLGLHGMTRDAWKRYSSAGSWYYEVVAPGFKANMTDLQAAIGIHQLARLDDFVAERRRQAALYDDAFSSVGELIKPVRLSDRHHSFHLYVIGLETDRLTIGRDDFITRLRDHNVGTSVHFIPVHVHPYYRKKYGLSEVDFPTASLLFRRSLSLPLYPGMADSDIEYTTGVVNQLLAEYRK